MTSPGQGHTSPRRRKQLNSESAKRKEENRRREQTRRIVAKRSGGLCEARILIATVDPVAASNCKRKAVDLHEKKKAGRGGSRTDPSNLLHVCRSCHDFTEAEVAKSTEAGLLVPSWE